MHFNMIFEMPKDLPEALKSQIFLRYSLPLIGHKMTCIWWSANSTPPPSKYVASDNMYIFLILILSLSNLNQTCHKIPLCEWIVMFNRYKCYSQYSVENYMIIMKIGKICYEYLYRLGFKF